MKFERFKNNYKLIMGDLVIGIFNLRQLQRLKDLIEGILEEESQMRSGGNKVIVKWTEMNLEQNKKLN